MLSRWSIKFALVCFVLILPTSLRSEIRVGISHFQGKSIDTPVEGSNIELTHLSPVFHPFSNMTLALGGGLRLGMVESKNFPIQGKTLPSLKQLSIQRLNIAVHVEAQWHSWQIGFNIDTLGVSRGRESTLNGQSKPTSPQSPNLLRGASRDRGSLDSQAWLGWRTPSWILQVGLSHQAVGISDEDQEYQRFFDAIFIGAQVVVSEI